MNRPHRPLGDSGVEVGPLGLGCWPLAGMTRSGITHEAAVATVRAALDAGIRHLDTAYCYGETGESERAIARVLAEGRREAAVIATKCGIHWEAGRRQVVDGRPATIRREVEESLSRLGTDHVDLLYLHAPDPTIPIEDSAGELARLLREGKTRAVGLSNVSTEQLDRSAAVCPISACQMHFNMLQREIEADVLPWCRDRGVAVVAYWPLMKGLLAGLLGRDHVFPATDSRHKYPMFNGEEYRRNLDFVDRLRPVADGLGVSLTDLVLAWTAEQPGITCVLFGATSADQARINARAVDCELDDDARRLVAEAILERGPVASRRPV